MLNPVHRAGANELVERYIGTAYENIKIAADNIAAINKVALLDPNDVAQAATIDAAAYENIRIAADSIEAINKAALLDMAAITQVATLDATALADLADLAGTIDDITTVAQAVRDADNFKGTYLTEDLLIAGAVPDEGAYAHVDAGAGYEVKRYVWDNDDSVWVHDDSAVDYGNILEVTETNDYGSIL